MSYISEDDKKTWDDYLANLNSLVVNFQYNKKNLINRPKNLSFKKSSSHNFFKQKRTNYELDGILDLHGYRLYNAKIILQKYVQNAYENNLRNILIVTGKGHNNTGVLKKEVPLWLNDKILINFLINFEIAPKKFGGEGALIVRIKNKNKSRFI